MNRYGLFAVLCICLLPFIAACGDSKLNDKKSILDFNDTIAGQRNRLARAEKIFAASVPPLIEDTSKIRDLNRAFTTLRNEFAAISDEIRAMKAPKHANAEHMFEMHHESIVDQRRLINDVYRSADHILKQPWPKEKKAQDIQELFKNMEKTFSGAPKEVEFIASQKKLAEEFGFTLK